MTVVLLSLALIALVVAVVVAVRASRAAGRAATERDGAARDLELYRAGHPYAPEDVDEARRDAVRPVMAEKASLEDKARAYMDLYRYTRQDVEEARKESVTKSRSVVTGQVSENMAPYLPGMVERFNPREARFLGAPIDFVIFDGLEDGHVDQVVFVEVKTGKARLSQRERLVRDAIQDGRITWEIMRMDSTPPPLELVEPSRPLEPGNEAVS